MTIKTVYKGTIEWHEGNPDKSGRYIASISNNWVDIVTFYKKDGKNVFETSDEGENGRITVENVNAWAYLPEPYKKA